jgi:hypothetical protein
MKWWSFAHAPVAQPLPVAFVEPVVVGLVAFVEPALAGACSETVGFGALGKVRSNWLFPNGAEVSAAKAKAGTARTASAAAAMMRFMMIPFG